ncbi:hypothetical protein BH11PLA1_BH11PLA1_00480 [soil metagenome]
MPAAAAPPPAQSAAGSANALTLPAIVSVTSHRGAAAQSFWLSSGVRVHLRPIADSGKASFCVRVLGGELVETPETRGLASLAASAWTTDSAPPAPADGSAPARVLISAGPESLALRGTGSWREVQSRLARAGTLLAAPQIDADRFARAKSDLLQIAATGDASLAQQPPTLLSAMRWTTDPRTAPPRRAVVEGFTVDDCRAWLAARVRAGPIEVALAGEFDTAEAVAALQHAFANVAPTPRVAHDSHAALRAAAIERAPAFIALPSGAGGTLHILLAGPDLNDLDAGRETTLLAALLKDRLSAALTPTGLIWGTPVVAPRPGRALTGTGALALTLRPRAVVREHDETHRAIAAALDSALATLSDPATYDTAAVNMLRASEVGRTIQRLREPEYWALVLSYADFYGLDLDELAAAPQRSGQITPQRLAARALLIRAVAPRFVSMLPRESAPAELAPLSAPSTPAPAPTPPAPD